jgi:predicted phosphohydrolase
MLTIFEAMRLFALSDPHLSFGTPEKSMDRFGEQWVKHSEKIQKHWTQQVDSKDVVVLPGDISWARNMEQVLPDLLWIHALPGTKIILKGNHDHWWPKNTTQKQEIPDSIHLIQNNSCSIGPYIFFGARLWDTTEYSVMNIIDWNGELPSPPSKEEIEKIEKLYNRELDRLQLSIESLQKNVLQSDMESKTLIGLCHYPPLNSSLESSRASHLFETTGAKHVIFGHLHSVQKGTHFGKRGDTEYHLTSCDYIDFKLKYICG